MTTSSATATLAALLLVGACGTDSASGELVIADASREGKAPAVLGASADAVYWSVAMSDGTRDVIGAPLGALPADGEDLGAATGPVVPSRDHVLLATASSILRTGVAMTPSKVSWPAADALGEGPVGDPQLVWATADRVVWGVREAEGSTILPKITRADQLQVTADRIYAAGDSTTGERRLLRIDRKTGVSTQIAGSNRFSGMFPGGGKTGADFDGQLVGADDDGALWLVTETPANTTKVARAILVLIPESAEQKIVLDHIGALSAFFATPDGFYWQEGDAVLSAPRTGGAASLEAHVAGQAGAVAGGFVYYVNGSAIERLSLD